MDLALDPGFIKRSQRHKALVIAALLAMLCLVAWDINRVVGPSVEASGLMLAQVRIGNIANTVNASGIMIPLHEELVSSPIQTHVAKAHAKPGQQVRAGELLLELDERAVVLAIDSIRKQLAQPENRIAALALALELSQKRKQTAGSPSATATTSARRLPPSSAAIPAWANSSNASRAWSRCRRRNPGRSPCARSWTISFTGTANPAAAAASRQAVGAATR